MKKIRSLLAIILALSLLFITQVTAFAAEEDIGEGHENEALVEEAHTAAGSEEPSEVVPVYTVIEEEILDGKQFELLADHTHTKGKFIGEYWTTYPGRYDSTKHCYYDALYQSYSCASCKTTFSVIADYRYKTHNKVYDYSSENQYKGWHCSSCGYYSWK